MSVRRQTLMLTLAISFKTQPMTLTGSVNEAVLRRLPLVLTSTATPELQPVKQNPLRLSILSLCRICLGSYAFIETSFPRTLGDTARLISKPLKDSGGCNMTFCYHMYGSDVRNLTVYVEDMASGLRSQVWKMSGNRGNKWFNATVFPGRVRGSFSVRLLRNPNLLCCSSFPVYSLYSRVYAEYPIEVTLQSIMWSSQMDAIA